MEKTQRETYYRKIYKKSVPAAKVEHSPGSGVPFHVFQNHLSNHAIQRLLAQRTGDGPSELDDDTADRINRARGGGQTLDSVIQQKMGEAMGSDFSGVNVHTGNEAHELNHQLGARAFTTGRDIFFRSGEYNPQSSGGQELLAHELTHVVQQSSGAVPGGGKLAVNAPGDRFEQEADAVAREITSGPSPAAAPGGVQRQELPEEEEVQAQRVQREEVPEDELQTQRLQRQELPEEEEPVQMQELPEDELEAGS